MNYTELKLSDVNKQNMFNYIALQNHINKTQLTDDCTIVRFICTSDAKKYVSTTKRKGIYLSHLFVSSSAFPEYFIFTI